MNKSEFLQLYSRYKESLHKYIASLTNQVDDIEQDTWLCIWKYRQNFIFSNISFALLKQIAYRRLVDYIRKQDKFSVCSINNVVLSYCIDMELFSIKTKNALKTLSETTKKCVLDILVNGYTHQEMADKMNVSINTISSLVYYNKKKLRKLLK